MMNPSGPSFAPQVWWFLVVKLKILQFSDPPYTSLEVQRLPNGLPQGSILVGFPIKKPSIKYFPKQIGKNSRPNLFLKAEYRAGGDNIFGINDGKKVPLERVQGGVVSKGLTLPTFQIFPGKRIDIKHWKNYRITTSGWYNRSCSPQGTCDLQHNHIDIMFVGRGWSLLCNQI